MYFKLYFQVQTMLQVHASKMYFQVHVLTRSYTFNGNDVLARLYTFNGNHVEALHKIRVENEVTYYWRFKTASKIREFSEFARGEGT